MSRIRFAIVLVCTGVASGTLVAPASAGPPVGGTATQRELPRDDPHRGPIYDGHERVATGPCARLLRLERTYGCTHGPDPAPAGLSVAADPVLVTFPAGASPRVQCDGDGSSGARVQVLYAHASDATDRFTQFAGSSASGPPTPTASCATAQATRTASGTSASSPTRPTAG